MNWTIQNGAGYLLAGLAFFLVLSAPEARAETPFWMKTWTVTGVRNGLPEDRDVYARIVGMQIAMKPDQLVDPLDEGCTHALSYADVRSRPTSELGEHFGNFWKWPALPSSAIYGWIRCNGSNVGGFIFIDAQRADLIYEEGAILLLR